MISQHEIENADLHFDPPLTKRANKRKVFLIAKGGQVLAGITVRVPQKGKVDVTVPAGLLYTSDPDHDFLDSEISRKIGYQEWPLKDLTRETLALRVREALSRGIAPWPEEKRRNSRKHSFN